MRLIIILIILMFLCSCNSRVAIMDKIEDDYQISWTDEQYGGLSEYTLTIPKDYGHLDHSLVKYTARGDWAEWGDKEVKNTPEYPQRKTYSGYIRIYRMADEEFLDIRLLIARPNYYKHESSEQQYQESSQNGTMRLIRR